MKIHEYQAKAILKKYGVTVPRGFMATSREEAESLAKDLLSSGSTGVVVKAQIHAGGRGKGGGVKIAKSVDEAADLAGKMLGMKLVTHQTGPEGRIVRRLLIEETLPIEKELYLGILVDRAEGKPVFDNQPLRTKQHAGGTRRRRPTTLGRVREEGRDTGAGDWVPLPQTRGGKRARNKSGQAPRQRPCPWPFTLGE